MGFGKILAGIGVGVGAILLAPVALPAAAAAAAGTAAAAVGTAAATVGTAVASTAIGSAAVGAATAVGTAAAGAATAVAGTAVGSAAIGAATTAGAAATGVMAAVGGAVGTAAGAAGLSSVATVAGTSAGAAAVGTITTMGAVGVGTAAAGAEKMVRASDIEDSAVRTEKRAAEKLKHTQTVTNNALENLGREKVEDWIRLKHYVELCNKITDMPLKSEMKLDGRFVFDEMEMKHIEEAATSILEVLGQGAVTATSGQLIGLAASSGITSMATASTGTAIAGLHGAAAANASLAALGGGSLASGGLGMAGGAVVANVLTFAPVMAISGMFINSHGSKKLKNAEQNAENADTFAKAVDNACKELNALKKLSDEMLACLHNYGIHYEAEYVTWLGDLLEVKTSYRDFTRAEQDRLLQSFKLTVVFRDLVCTQLVNSKTNKVEAENVRKIIATKKQEFPLNAA